MIKQTLKNLIRIAITPIIAGGLIACTDTSDYFAKKGAFGDGKGDRKYEAYVWGGDGERHLEIQHKNSSLENPSYLCAVDKNNDNRFDEVKLVNIPKGDPIEQYANLQSLEEIYKEICEQEEDLK